MHGNFHNFYKEIQMKTVNTVKTKLDKNDKNPIVTVLTFDFEGVKMEDLVDAASQTLIINKQGQWRRAKKIPAQETVSVKDMIARMGTRSQAPATPETIVATVGSMTKAERDAIIARLAELDRADKAAAKKGTSKPSKGDGEKGAPATA